MTDLRIARGFSLSPDFATKTVGILAQRRKGKTYTASVIAEELVAAGIPFVALDPTGAWWGLRARADGKGAGLSVVILGGQHGDLPLERGAGRFVADLVVEHPGFYVIDFSLFPSSAAEREFATDFAERLYRRKAQPGLDFPLHLLVDEADRFTPQRVPSGDQRMLGAFEALVRRGGLRGIGTTLISQRAAVVNKNVLEQLDVLIVLRTVGPNDRAAVEDYVKAHGTLEQRQELMGSLASLELGEAWIWEPGADPPLFERIRVRERRTFNSSATPKIGEKRIEPTRLADVDLAAIKEAMSEFIERADAQDPAKLQKRVRVLEVELAKAQRAASVLSEPTVREIRVEVPIVPQALVDELSAYRDGLEAKVREVYKLLADALAEKRPNSPLHARYIELQHEEAIERSTPPQPPVARPRNGDGDPIITPAKQRILDALAWLESVGMEASKPRLALMVDMSPKGGGFNNYLGNLRGADLIDYPRTGYVALTEAGREQATSDGAMTTAGLQEMLFAKVGPSKARILRVLIDAYPQVISKEDLAAAVEMSVTGGGFNNYLGSLRGVGLIDYPAPGSVVALPVLFLEGR